MEQQKENNQVKSFKIALIGDTGVGKTSIFLKYHKNTFNGNHITTVSIDFEVKNVKYNNNNYSIKIFDTAGQERFKSMITPYFHMADGFFVVFDLTNKNSLNSVSHWIELINDKKKDSKFIILGNKDDLENNKLNDNEINDVLNKIENYNNKLFYKVSAKEGKNLTEVFNKMLELLDNKNIIEEDNKSFGLKKTGKKQKISNNKKCC